MSVIPSTETAGAILWQALCFVENICNLGSRGWRIWQTWNDPTTSKTEKAFYITLDGAGILANTTILANAYHPNSDDKDGKNLQKIVNAVALAGDARRILSSENRKDSDVATLGTKTLLVITQHLNGGESLENIINASGTIVKCYLDREQTYEQINRARNMTNMLLERIKGRLSQNQENNAQEGCSTENNALLNQFIQKDPQADYEDQVLFVQKKHPEKNELEILETVKEDFNEALNELINSMLENNFIINKKDASKFIRIPSILSDREEFKEMKCRITFKPIREVVVVSEPDTNTPIYYEFSTLNAVYIKTKDKKKDLPLGWPKSIPFSKEFIQSNEEKTEIITEALNQAILNPEVRRLAKLVLPESKKLRDRLEKTLEICDEEIALLEEIQKASKSPT